MQLFENLRNSIGKHNQRNAFCINGVFYSYECLAETISRIRQSVQQNSIKTQECIGVVTNDDIESYAAIIAVWLEGKIAVPLSPETPQERNLEIIQQASIKTIIDSSDNSLFSSFQVIPSKKTPKSPINLIPKKIADRDILYLLFTSGTTGVPKGVPISLENLDGFVSSFYKMGIMINENDKFLQMFELTFDLSIYSYIIPLLNGSCVYTVPKKQIKYGYVYELMKNQKLTVTLMVPSILQYLRPYFNEIKLPEMRFSLFCGEALSLAITNEWSNCLPNATIINTYGPTENTIFCTSYTYQKSKPNKSHNGILSIGKPMQNVETIIIDNNNKILPAQNTGELCLGGKLLTKGYWENEEQNKEAFFLADYNGKQTRFYKTGDVCFQDEEGDMFFNGRVDSQIKVQGFRVELSEIEFHVKAFLTTINIAAISIIDLKGNTEIGLVIESEEINTLPLLDYLNTKIPAYMIPKQIQFVSEFMLNANGKSDLKKLAQLFILP